MSSTASHPNRVPFEGVLTVVDTPSDRSPSGARSHCVILTAEAALEALPSLLGMAVAFKAGYDGHDARQKCGIITQAFLVGLELKVRGYIYGRDFPEVGAEIRVMDMGMSYELCDAHVLDMREAIWTLTKVTFTGAAILLRRKAAYLSTSIRLLTASEIEADARLPSYGDEDLLELRSHHASNRLEHVEAGLDVRLPDKREPRLGILASLVTETAMPDEDA